jgi:chromosome segregation ATPase
LSRTPFAWASFLIPTRRPWAADRGAARQRSAAIMDDSLSSVKGGMGSPSIPRASSSASTSPVAQRLFNQTSDALQRVKELRALQSGTKGVTTYIAQLQANLGDAASRLAERERELNVAQRDAAGAHRRVGTLAAALEEANSKIDQVNKQSSEAALTAKEELNRSARKRSDLKRQLRELAQDVEGCRAELLARSAAAEALQRTNADLDGELKQSRAQHAAAVRAKEREAEGIREELRNARGRGQALATQATALTTALEALRAEAERERAEAAAKHADELERVRQAKAAVAAELQVRAH